jgi:hypothetical protein
MTEEEARFRERAEGLVIRALRQVMAAEEDFGQQLIIHVAPRGRSVKVQLPPKTLEIGRESK